MSKGRNASWWVTSDEPAAMAWRAKADGQSFLAMCNQAYTDNTKPNRFGVPAEEVATPPIRTGKYFTLNQSTDSAPPAMVGKFFTVPAATESVAVGVTVGGPVTEWVGAPGWPDDD